MSLMAAGLPAMASEADIKIPDLTTVTFNGLGGVSGITLMYIGIAICVIGAIFGVMQYAQTKSLPVHDSMGKVSNTIWETCKTYLFTQGKFLAILWTLIAACMVYYFMVLEEKSLFHVMVILLASILGIAGSFGVAVHSRTLGSPRAAHHPTAASSKAVATPVPRARSST